MRKLSRWLIRLTALWFVLLVGWAVILAYPNVLLTYERTAGFLTVHSDEPVTSAIDSAMADVVARLEGIEVHQPETPRTVYVCQIRANYSFLAGLALVESDAQGFNLSLFGNSFVSLPRVTDLGRLTGGVPRYSIREGSLAHLMAHEIVHEELMEAIGRDRGRALPQWKLEGYTEYGANINAMRADSAATLASRIDILHEDRAWADGGEWARKHYRFMLMTEYLSEIRGYALADFIADSVTEDGTYAVMMAWRRGQETF